MFNGAKNINKAFIFKQGGGTLKLDQMAFFGLKVTDP